MKKIVVFCGSSLGFDSVFKNSAVALGNYFADNNIELIYGGGKVGMMGILADTILAKDGLVTGIIPTLLHKEEVLHPKVKNMLVTKTMSERKVMMSKMIDAYITLPGGLGTLDELFEALTINQLFIEQKPVAILNVDGFFDATLLQLDKMVEKGFLKAQNRKLLIEANTVEDLMQKIYDYKPLKKSNVIDKVVN
ncbi:TIGR00730 family Rossman fold protein [Polaribacter sp.]|nr:TIGR00730 family Rossman fold protein [Polaribacter sp.]